MEECYFTKINIYIQHLLNIQEVFTPSTGANLDVISKRTKPKYTRYLQSTMLPNLVLRTNFHENYLKNYQIKINSTWSITQKFTFTKTTNSSEAHIEPCPASKMKKVNGKS